VTQAGAAGIKQHRLVWSPINSTLRAVFPAVTAYKHAVYSFLDEWGWHMASDSAELVAPLTPAEVDARLKERLVGETTFLDGVSYPGLFSLSKTHRATLAAESLVMSREKGTFSFMHNQGLCVAKAGK
jgi:hypothetical protein